MSSPFRDCGGPSPTDAVAAPGCRALVHEFGPAAGVFARPAFLGRANGVVLRRRRGAGGQDFFEVAIAFGAERTDTPIHLAADDETVIARWRIYARNLGLRLIVEAQDGTQSAWGRQLGGVMLGETRARRRVGALLKHRPRFLARRRVGVAISGRQAVRGSPSAGAQHRVEGQSRE